MEVLWPEEKLKHYPTQYFDSRLGKRRKLDQSGVWRFRELISGVSENHIISKPEGRTNLYQSRVLSQWSNCETLWLKHEGENPSGSFKDRGMTVAISQAKHLGKTIVGCASTGNTSASLAAYAAEAGMQAFVFIPAGKISLGKLSQALAYGATCIQIRGAPSAARAW